LIYFENYFDFLHYEIVITLNNGVKLCTHTVHLKSNFIMTHFSFWAALQHIMHPVG